MCKLASIFARYHARINASRTHGSLRSHKVLCRADSVQKPGPLAGSLTLLGGERKVFFSTTVQFPKMSKTTLCLEDYDAYGFDVDHTLATYNVPNLFELLHTAFTRFLVDKKGYHKELLEPFHKYEEFCARGLVFDVQHGNFLKIAEDGIILRASHGTKFLTGSEIESRYPKRHWPPTDKLINHVDNIGDGEYMIFDNFFDMIGTVILSRVVDIVDKQAASPPTDYSKEFRHVKQAFNDAYNHTAFAEKTGGFFPPLTDDPSRYIDKVSDDIKSWLKSLRREGKVVFFITSSYIDFATFSLTYILGKDWKDYFDVGITLAKKPGFFHAGKPFLTVEGAEEKDATSELQRGEVYSQGNVKTLEEFISKTIGRDKPKVLYFGDSVQSDTFPSKSAAGWDTVTILAEMEGEISEDETTTNEDNGQPAIKRARKDGTGQMRCGHLPDSPWGSFYTDTVSDRTKSSPGDKGGEVRPTMNTMWGHIICKYSSLAVPSLKYFTGLPISHVFNVFHLEKAEQWGFHPSCPKALKPKKQ